MQEIIQKLPIAHQYLLLYLLDMISMFVTAQEYTRMDITCLSAVFAPVSFLFLFYFYRIGYLLIVKNNNMYRAFFLIRMTRKIQQNISNHKGYSSF